MYLADALRLIDSGIDPEFLQGSASLSYARHRARDVLRGAELFSFTSSALEVAADLVVDTPDRLERVAGAVLGKPRRVFVEASHLERMEAFRGMRGFPFVQREDDRFDPRRIGLDIQCFGDGRARIGVLWDFPKTEGRRFLKSMPSAPRTRLGREALVQILAFGVGFCFYDVDIARRDPVSRADFEAGLDVATGEIREFLDHAAAQIRRREGRDPKQVLSPRERKTVPMEAWRLYRLNSMARARLDPKAKPSCIELMTASGKTYEGVVQDARRDLDGELIYALAFLAAIDAGGDALARERRPRHPARRERPVAPRELQIDELSVLSFNISGKQGAAAGKKRTGGGGGVAGSVRSRHFVRGHLFHAGSGKMVYRRPHWRGGSARRKVLRRVT